MQLENTWVFGSKRWYSGQKSIYSSVSPRICLNGLSSLCHFVRGNKRHGVCSHLGEPVTQRQEQLPHGTDVHLDYENSAQKVWAVCDPILTPGRSNLTCPGVAEWNWCRCLSKCCSGQGSRHRADPSDKAVSRRGVFSTPVFPRQPEQEFRSDESSPNPSSFRQDIFHWSSWHLWKLLLNSGSSVCSHAQYQQGHNRQTLHISGNKKQLLCLQCCYCSLGTQMSLSCWMQGHLVGWLFSEKF